MGNRKSLLTVRARVLDGDTPRTIEAQGRYGQMLRELVNAGRRGVTSLEISSWALRTSHYVDVLRKDDRYRLRIRTDLETHHVDGMQPGRHARYFLETPVELIEPEAA